MERQELFDVLTIRFSDMMARRDVLRTLGRLVLAMIVFGVYPWRAVAQGAAPESALVKGCRLPGQGCGGKSKCCSRKCNGDHHCGCVNKGHAPLVDSPLGPVPVKALCCTNNLNKRTGECR